MQSTKHAHCTALCPGGLHALTVARARACLQATLLSYPGGSVFVAVCWCWHDTSTFAGPTVPSNTRNATSQVSSLSKKVPFYEDNLIKLLFPSNLIHARKLQRRVWCMRHRKEHRKRGRFWVKGEEEMPYEEKPLCLARWEKRRSVNPTLGNNGKEGSKNFPDDAGRHL